MPANKDNNINLKKAPKRDVIDIVREGEWGKVVYRHRLSCGHTETRKRIAPGIACSWCVVAEEKDADLKAIASPRQVSQVLIDVADIIDDNGSDWVAEQNALQIQGGLASALGIPIESVDVVLEDNDGELAISYALVFLSAGDALRIARSKSSAIIDI